MTFLKSFLSDRDDFKFALLISIAAHFIFVTFFIFKSLFFSKPLIDLSQAISVSIGELSPADKLPQKISHDEPIEAPDKPEDVQVNEKSKTEKITKKESLKPKDEAVNLSKTKQKLALDKLKKMSAIEKIKDDLQAENGKNKPVKKSANAKPRVIGAGAALTGLDKLEANNYLQLLDHNIKQSWTLPQWLMNKALKTRVLVKFNTEGQIISTEIISTSGNPTYDNYCLQAINKASPFPKVPEKFSEKFGLDGLVIGFPE